MHSESLDSFGRRDVIAISDDRLATAVFRQARADAHLGLFEREDGMCRCKA
jgi:hypothetical protein